MIKYIVENIKHPTEGQLSDIPWWMANVQGILTVKSAWKILRNNKESKEEYMQIWAKGLLLELIFFMLKV